jgi:Ion transport protein
VCSQSELGEFICPNGMYCGNHDEHLWYNQLNDQIHNREYINFGITNFDHIFSSLLTVFQIINSDTWSGQLMNFMDADIPMFGAFYCLMMIIVG